MLMKNEKEAIRGVSLLLRNVMNCFTDVGRVFVKSGLIGTSG